MALDNPRQYRDAALLFGRNRHSIRLNRSAPSALYIDLGGSHRLMTAAARFESQNNTIYVGADSLRLGRTPLGVNGGGVFREFAPRLRLTADGKTRSLWNLPAWFSPEGRLSSLSYHGKQSRWTQQGDSVLLQTVAKGQEFMLNCEHYPESESWIKDLFASFAQGHLENHP